MTHHTFNENPSSSMTLGRFGGMDYSVQERRDYLARPFSSVTDRNAQLLRNEHARINAERRARGQGKLLLKHLAVKYGVTQGAVSQYYRGREPLNTEWQMRFADWLGVSPVKIWPDFPYKGMFSDDLKPELIPLFRALSDNFNEEQLAAIRQLVNASPKKTKKT